MLGVDRDAIDIFNQVLHRDPNTPCALVGRALVNLNLAKVKAPLTDLNRLLALDSSNKGFYYDLEAQYFEKHAELTSALALRKQLAQKNVGNASAWFDLGNVYRRMNRYKDAVRSYKKASELDPANANYREHIAFAYLLLGKSEKQPQMKKDVFEKAAREIDEGFKLQFQSVSLHEDRVWLCLLNKECDSPTNALAALDEINRTMKLAPKEACAYSLRSDVYERLGRWDEAIDDANTAANLQPDESDAKRLSSLKKGKKAWVDFLAAIQTAISKDPRNPELFVAQAKALVSLGRPAEGLERYKQALRLLTPEKPGDRLLLRVKQGIALLEADPRVKNN